MSLPFQYGNRWRQLGGLFLPESLDDDLVSLLEERDRQLEDYLSGVTGGSVGLESTLLFATLSAIASGAGGTKMPMGTTSFDQLGTADLANDQITAPVDGVYMGWFNMAWNLQGAGVDNGAQLIGFGGVAPAEAMASDGNIRNEYSIGGVAHLTAGTAVYGQIFQVSGGNQTPAKGALSLTLLMAD